jgi:hypothetical protein
MSTNMEAPQKQHEWLNPLLVIYTLFSPSMIESETWGMGEEGMILDAVVNRSITSSSFWAFESNTYLTLGGPPNSAQFIFPYSAPIPVIVVWFLGCLSTGFVLLALKGKTSRDIGFLLVVALTLVPFFIPGLTENIVESFHTYRKSPLPIPQIAGIIILVLSRKLKLIS